MRARALFDRVHDLVATVTPEGAVTSINASGVTLLGLDGDGDELVLALDDLHPPELAERVVTELVPIVQTRGEWSGELLMRHRDGSTIEVAYQLLDLSGDGGEAELGIVAHDLTRAKRAETVEERLLREHQQLKTVIDSTSDFIAMADLDGKISFVNPAGLAMCGRSGEDYRTLHVTDFQPPEDFRRLMMEAFPFVRERNEAWIGEMHFYHVDGTSIPVSQVITVVRDEAGDIIGYATIARDISELRRSAAELRAAKESAEAANRAKSEFLANMSHELRTPLNVILGFTQLLERDCDLSLHQIEQIKTISKSGEHLLGLINDVLEMSKIEAGCTLSNTSDFDLQRLLGDVEEMFHVRAEARGLDLRFECADDTPRFVHTDEAKLRQILFNLIGNAIKFTQAGEVVVSTEHLAGQLVFAVSDTGPGVAPDDHEALFQAFTQTNVGIKSQSGTGLGLSISRHFVRLLGGDMTVESELGRGATFRFAVDVTLPERPRLDSVADPPRREVVGLAPGTRPPRILIAEDREQNRLVLVHLLHPLGFDLRGATNGREALAVWEAWDPDLIWMDMRMPEMDGYEATREIRARAPDRRPVIIALTASAFEGDRAKMLAVGCDDFLRKPFKHHEILDRIGAHLDLHYTYRDQADEHAPTPTEHVLVALRGTPRRWREDVKEVTVRAEFARLLALFEEIEPQAPALASALIDLAKDYEYEKISWLIENSLAAS